MKNKESLRFYTDLLRPQRSLLFFAILFACIKAAIESPLPRVAGILIDHLKPEGHGWFEENTSLIILGLLGYLLVYLPVTYARGYFPRLVACRVFFSLRTRLFRHLQGLSADFYLKNRTGDLTSRLINDIVTSSTTVVNILTRVAFDSFLVIPSLYFMFSISWHLTSVLLVYATVQFLAMRRVVPHVKEQSRQVSKKLGEISSDATEKLGGIDLIRSSAREEKVDRDFANLNQDHLYLSLKLMRFSLFWTTLIHGVGDKIPTIVLILLGYFSVKSGISTTGDVVAIVLYAPFILGPVNRSVQALAQWAQAMGAMSRIHDIFTTMPSIQDKPDAIALESPRGAVEFRNVTFSYPRQDKQEKAEPVIKDMNLAITPGQVVALVGPSGSGKTTISQLLLRFYEAKVGEICIDDHDIRDLTQLSLRRAIGCVMQESIVFQRFAKRTGSWFWRQVASPSQAPMMN